LTDIVELTVPVEKATVVVKETDHAVIDWPVWSDVDKLAFPEKTNAQPKKTLRLLLSAEN